MHLESRGKNHTFRIWIVHQHPTRNRKKKKKNTPYFKQSNVEKWPWLQSSWNFWGWWEGCWKREKENRCSSRIRKPLLLLDRLLGAHTDCCFDGTTLVLSGKPGAALLLDSWQRWLGKQVQSSNPSTKRKQVWSWQNRYYQGTGKKYVLA